MVVVIKLEAVEADVVRVSPRGQQVQLKDDCRRGGGGQGPKRHVQWSTSDLEHVEI